VPALSPFIVKLASRCNLNCSYCYVYNKGDTSWRARPAHMSRETFDATIERIRSHCLASAQPIVLIVFHGGEPTLIGAERFGAMCRHARTRLADVTELVLTMQTNATRLDEAWIATLREHSVYVGVSLDGPPEINDRVRVDHKGRGSYNAVVRGIDALREGGLPFALLSVVQPGADSVDIHRHFVGLGPASISYLLPAHTHESVLAVRDEFGPTPCADYLIPVFDEWWFTGTPNVSVREFWNLGRLIMGGRSQVDSLGNPPLRYVSVETDGSIQGVDKLRICEDGLTATSLNVHESAFSEIIHASALHGSILDGVPLPTGCSGCPEAETCAGGYLPHRYSKERQFDNPSVWCADLLALFDHVRMRMGVDHDETDARRRALAGRAAGESVAATFDPFTVAAV
jgi:uncharacterized protein